MPTELSLAELRKLIKILELLKDTMVEVRGQNKVLDMITFFEDKTVLEEGTTIHNCGTPACVAGYAALNPKIRREAGLEEGFEDRSRNNLDPYGYAAEFLWQYVEELHTDLANILFDMYPEDRARYFTKTFPQTDPTQFNHLVGFNPTPDDAIQLLDWLMDNFKSREAAQ